MMTDKRMRRNAATILLFAAALAIAAALLIVLSGGFSSPALTLRDPRRPLGAAGVLIAAAWLGAGRDFPSLVWRVTGPVERLPAHLAMAASASVLVFAMAWTSRAAGGSDSSCYVLQAEAFAHGHATLANPVAAALPDAPNAVFAPTGFLPSRHVHGVAVPICAPGLALAMTPAFLVHSSAVFLVVPVTAAALVWLTFVFGRRVDGDLTGACAAVLVACSPIVLYQAVQPMSDVPAAAAWLAALLSLSPLGAGVWASIAVLIRPNLALLVPLLVWWHAKRGQPPVLARKGNSQVRAATAFALGAAPGLLVLLALNAVRYGSPVASGYGAAGLLFTPAHVTANLLRYPRWLIDTQTPFVLLALAAPFAVRRDPARASFAWLSLATVALLAATYLAYTVFDDWWYIRFLLPAIPILVALSVAVLRSVVGRLPASAVAVALAAVTAVLAAWYIHVALARHAGDLQAFESRFRLTGEYAGAAFPDTSVFISVQQSGSIRFHGHRDTIAWDAIPGDALDATVATLRARGRAPFIAVEDAEEAPFRARFASQRAGALDWRPAAEVPASRHVRIYAPTSETR
jgi:hypothetical protein